MELDIFIPRLSLAFEYQGEQHYHQALLGVNDPAHRKRLDLEKLLACERLGITLIEIPYWWDRSVESLQMTIKRIRPDLDQSRPLPNAAPIPVVPKHLSTSKKGTD